MIEKPRISLHALLRYQERVKIGATEDGSKIGIHKILASARVRPYPRRWMKRTRMTPGTKYLYSAEQPGVCIIVRNDTVVTVISRAASASWRAGTTDRACSRGRRITPPFRRRHGRRKLKERK